MATDPFYVLNLTGPAFVLITLGYLTMKAAWLNRENAKTLGWFITHIALPAAIFQAFQSRNIDEILHFNYLLIYASGSLMAFLVVFTTARLVRRKSLTESSFFALGSSMSNSILVGFPILVALFDTRALVPFALVLLVENLIILPLSLALADLGRYKKRGFAVTLRHLLAQLASNPIFLAILTGVTFSVLSIKLPMMLGTAIDSLAFTVSGLAQFTIGTILAGTAFSLKSRAMVADVSLILVGKLICHPLAVLLLIFILPPLDPVQIYAAIILASMPMFSVYPVFGMQYGLGEVCSAALLITTLVSFVTINLVIWLVSRQPGFW